MDIKTKIEKEIKYLEKKHPGAEISYEILKDGTGLVRVTKYEKRSCESTLYEIKLGSPPKCVESHEIFTEEEMDKIKEIAKEITKTLGVYLRKIGKK